MYTYRRARMKLRDNIIHITVKFHLSFWDALKLRIAGKTKEEKPKEEAGDIRINEETGKVEKCSVAYYSKEGFLKIWVDYDEVLLTNTLGICPQCNSSFSLFHFRGMAVMKERKGDKENEAYGQE